MTHHNLSDCKWETQRSRDPHSSEVTRFWSRVTSLQTLPGCPLCYTNVKVQMYPTTYLQTFSGFGHYPHQVLKMLLLTLAKCPPWGSTRFPSPHCSVVSLSCWPPPAHLCPGTGITSSSSANCLAARACTCSAPAAAKFPCTNADNDLARPCHHPRHLGQMSSAGIQCQVMKITWCPKVYRHTHTPSKLSLSNEKCTCPGCSLVISPAPSLPSCSLMPTSCKCLKVRAVYCVHCMAGVCLVDSASLRKAGAGDQTER